MGKSHTAILKAFRGKRVVFKGKFKHDEPRLLEKMAEAHGATSSFVLNSATDYLVVADMQAAKTICKTVAGLNAKGAKIQVLDISAFKQKVTLSLKDVVELIRGGAKNAEALADAMGRSGVPAFQVHWKPVLHLVGEKFDGLNLSGFSLDVISFNQCSFNRVKAESTLFNSVVGCDFSNADLGGCEFRDVARGCFRNAKGKGCIIQGDISGTDWTGAVLDYAFFTGVGKVAAAANISFAGASLRAARLFGLTMTSPNLQKADLSGASVRQCELKSADFRSAVLEDALLSHCKLQRADFGNAKLRGADFEGSDLTGATFRGADLQDVDFSTAEIAGADFSGAINYHPGANPFGPAVTAFDAAANQARHIVFTFKIVDRKTKRTETVGLDVHRLKHRLGGIMFPYHVKSRNMRQRRSAGAGLTELAAHLGNWRIRYETLDVRAVKSPARGEALRNLIIQAIAEATGQASPAADLLDTAFRKKKEAEKVRHLKSVETIKRLQAKHAVSDRKRIARTIEKKVGKIGSIEAFLKALELRIDRPKLEKATAMLKAESFQLFNDVTPTHLNGVVRSQSEANRVYASRIESSGKYACCTQNLLPCGGLRGGICKHLLVLIIGLVKAGKLDPAEIDQWIAKAQQQKPELNKEAMSEIFIRYKGAEAGEIDWRPTETVPEDYYAV